MLHNVPVYIRQISCLERSSDETAEYMGTVQSTKKGDSSYTKHLFFPEHQRTTKANDQTPHGSLLMYSSRCTPPVGAIRWRLTNESDCHLVPHMAFSLSLSPKRTDWVVLLEATVADQLNYPLST